MDTRSKIFVYSKFGGAWNHLRDELLKNGLSQSFCEKFINNYRKNLSEENATEAVDVYDQWIQSDDKELIELFLIFRYFF